MQMGTARARGALLWVIASSGACASDETAHFVGVDTAPEPDAGEAETLNAASADASIRNRDETPCISGDRDRDGLQDCDDHCPDDPRKQSPEACGCGVPESSCAPSPGSPAPTTGTAVTSPTEPAPAPTTTSSASAAPSSSPDAGGPSADASAGLPSCAVGPIPDSLRRSYVLAPFYTRYADAQGVPVIASDAPSDEALRRACMLVRDFVGVRNDVRQKLLDQKIRFAMMGRHEKTVNLPEFAYLGDIDRRARGLGGVPTAVCAEENILCERMADRWVGESICVHEFSHTMQMAGYSIADPKFDARLGEAFDAATNARLFANTYAGSEVAEYFAEGVQDWYNTNQESPRPDGVHNQVNTRAELRAYDPKLYAILASVLPDKPAYRDCYHFE
jgi:hypothetical protein